MGKRTSLCVPRSFDGVLKGQDAGGENLPAVGLTSEAPFSVLIWVLKRKEKSKDPTPTAHRFFLQECIALRAPARNAVCCYNSPAVILPFSKP